jgi:hypothetical protein
MHAEMHVGLHVKCRHLCPKLTKIGIFQQNTLKLCNMKFYLNILRRSGIVTRGQTDGRADG